MIEAREDQRGSNKVFIVGLDGGTLDLVRPWVEQGYLPTFQRLMKEGLSSDLSVELPPGTVPNWPSFMTGKNAGKHGVIHWFTREDQALRWSIVNSHSIREKSLWEILGEHGKESIVMNVPLTYPPKPMKGLMITGLLTPPSAKDFTHPIELQNEIESKVGRYMIYPDAIYREGKEEKFLSSLMKTLDVRFRTSRYLMETYPWDLFMIVFSETDAIQHAFWKFIDPLHPSYDERLAHFGKGILQVYQKIDTFLKEYLSILEKGEKGTTLIIMSDHGAGSLYKKFYTNNWLRSLGLLTLKRDFWSQLKEFSFRHGLTMQNLYRFAFKVGLANWRRMVDKKESAESLMRKLFLSYHDIDWERTQAFAFGGFGQIYLNVKEEHAGLSSSTELYEEVRDEIIHQLLKMEGPGGGRFMDRVYKREELYFGKNSHRLPDIVFMPRAGYVDPGDFEFFSNRIFDDAIGASGTHSQNGIFLIWGEAVKSDATLGETRIHDLAPTVLCLMDVPVPTDMDGRVLLESLKDEWVEMHPVRYIVPEEGSPEQDHSYSSEEEKEIKERLKGLGYLA
jgi:predicted AlkP superfamily phosphohydrolase/phosphomutase